MQWVSKVVFSTTKQFNFALARGAWETGKRFDHVEGDIGELRTKLERILIGLTLGFRHRPRSHPRQRRLSQPPIGALGLAPQKTTVPSMPRMWTATMLKTIDLAVAVPTPTGPPEAV